MSYSSSSGKLSDRNVAVLSTCQLLQCHASHVADAAIAVLLTMILHQKTKVGLFFLIKNSIFKMNTDNKIIF